MDQRPAHSWFAQLRRDRWLFAVVAALLLVLNALPAAHLQAGTAAVICTTDGAAPGGEQPDARTKLPDLPDIGLLLRRYCRAWRGYGRCVGRAAIDARPGARDSGMPARPKPPVTASIPSGDRLSSDCNGKIRAQGRCSILTMRTVFS